ncbi:MAG: hypothetical protein ABJA82_08195 [Myxococcales bacterium]
MQVPVCPPAFVGHSVFEQQAIGGMQTVEPFVVHDFVCPMHE